MWIWRNTVKHDAGASYGGRERKEVKKGKFDRDRNGKKGRGEMRWDRMAMGFVLCVFLFGL